MFEHFWWTAIWAAILLSIVGWVFSGPFRSAERALVEPGAGVREPHDHDERKGVGE